MYYCSAPYSLSAVLDDMDPSRDDALLSLISHQDLLHCSDITCQRENIPKCITHVHLGIQCNTWGVYSVQYKFTVYMYTWVYSATIEVCTVCSTSAQYTYRHMCTVQQLRCVQCAVKVHSVHLHIRVQCNTCWVHSVQYKCTVCTWQTFLTKIFCAVKIFVLKFCTRKSGKITPKITY